MHHTTTEAYLQLEKLLPHRSPMLLLDKAVDVDESSGTALIFITSESTFFVPDFGVPAWVGLEYMGQTAAMIGGYQLIHGGLEAHTGFLLGSRKFHSKLTWFSANTTLRVQCRQTAVVGETLANFSGEIYLQDNEDTSPVASATLSVFRQPNDAEHLPELTV